MPVATITETIPRDPSQTITMEITEADTRAAKAKEALNASDAAERHPRAVHGLSSLALRLFEVADYVSTVAGSPGGIFLPHDGSFKQVLEEIRKNPPLDSDQN